MPSYTYKAKDQKGQPIIGTLEAESRGAVNARLQAMGYFPIDIQGGKESKGVTLKSLSLRRGIKIRSDDLSTFYRQISDLIGAGVPLVKSLGIIKSQTTNPALNAVMGQINADVQGGDTFARALEKHDQVFSKLTVALVRAGETGGLLDQIMNRIADYSEAQDEVRSKVKAALAYPFIMVLVGALAIIVLLTFVMPKVLGIFEELDQQLPILTQMLIDFSEFLQKYGVFLIIGAIALVMAFKRYIKTEHGAMKFHKFLLRIPKFGDLILKREVGAFARTLGSLLQNGVPVLNALDISAEVMSLMPIRKELLAIPESITQGAGMSPALRQSDLFPAVVVNMVAIGEETGRLPEILSRVADSYETQVDRDLKMLTSIIEPLVMVLLGLIVFVIVLAMLLPIFTIDPGV
jgi:type II secretion system protein F